MNPLTLYPHEIRRLLDTGSVTVWRPMKPQPPEGEIVQYGEYHPALSMASGELRPGPRVYGAWAEDWDCLAPHPPGSERWVRETWAPYDTDGVSKVAVVYRASYDESCDGSAEAQGAVKWFDAPTCEFVAKFRYTIARFEVEGERWHSSVTMPRWASRLSVASREVQARQVQSVTEEEAVEAGLSDLTAFSEWWQRRFDTLGPNPWAWATTLERKEG